MPLSIRFTKALPPLLASKLLLTSSKWKEAKLWGQSRSLHSHPGNEQWPSAGHRDRRSLAKQAGVWPLRAQPPYSESDPGAYHTFVCITHSSAERPASAFLREAALSGDYRERGTRHRPARPVLHRRLCLRLNHLQMFIHRVWVRNVFFLSVLFFFYLQKEKNNSGGNFQWSETPWERL